jgi:hypothetical protein
MSEDVSRMSLEVNGKTAVKSAISILETHACDEAFDRVYIELGKPAQHKKTQSGHSRIVDPDKTENEAPKNIRKNTSHHAVLSGLSRFENELPVSTAAVLDVTHMPQGTAYAAMSELNERGLVERTDTKNENNSYEYRLTNAGWDELDRLGTVEHSGE